MLFVLLMRFILQTGRATEIQKRFIAESKNLTNGINRITTNSKSLKIMLCLWYAKYYAVLCYAVFCLYASESVFVYLNICTDSRGTFSRLIDIKNYIDCHVILL